MIVEMLFLDFASFLKLAKLGAQTLCTPPGWLHKVMRGHTRNWEETVFEVEGYNLSTVFYLLITFCADSLFLRPGRWATDGFRVCILLQPTSRKQVTYLWGPVWCWRLHVLPCYYPRGADPVEGRCQQVRPPLVPHCSARPFFPFFFLQGFSSAPGQRRWAGWDHITGHCEPPALSFLSYFQNRLRLHCLV